MKNVHVSLVSFLLMVLAQTITKINNKGNNKIKKVYFSNFLETRLCAYILNLKFHKQDTETQITLGGFQKSV